MSKTCGDTARFNRLRKQKIARRQNVRELRAAIDAAKVPKPLKLIVPEELTSSSV